jgi:hypothetical protein
MSFQSGEDERAGARALIQHGLRLARGDLLFVLCQEEFDSTGKCIEIAAQELGIRIRILHFRREEFFGGYKAAFGRDFLRQDNPKGIALIMEWSPETTSGRLKLLEHLAQSGGQKEIAD